MWHLYLAGLFTGLSVGAMASAAIWRRRQP